MTFFLKRPTLPTYQTKVADVRLPYDDSKWQDEIIGALHEQHPYLPHAQLQLSLNIRNVKQGYAVGNVNVADRVRVPVIIDRFLLKPFDMFLKDGQLHPMTKSSFRAAVEPRNFGTTTPPGQGETSDVFLTHSRPPYDGKYTFAAWTEGDPEQIGKALEHVFGTDDAEYFKAGDPIVGTLLDRVRQGDFSAVKHIGTVRPLETNEQRKNIIKSAAIRLVEEPTDELEAGVVKLANSAGTTVSGLLCDRQYDLFTGAKYDKHVFVEPGRGYDMDRVFYGQQVCKQAQFETVRAELPAVKPETGATGMWLWTEHGKVACTSVTTIDDQRRDDRVYFVGGVSGKPVHQVVRLDNFLKTAVRDGHTLSIPGDAHWVSVPNHHTAYGQAIMRHTGDYCLLQEAGGSVKIAVYQDHTARVRLDGFTHGQTEKWLGTYFEPESVDTVMRSVVRQGTIKIAAHQAMFARQQPPKANLTEVISRVRDHAKTATAALFAIKDSDVSPLMARDVAALATIDPYAARLIKIAASVDPNDRANSVDAALGLNIINDHNIQRFLDGIDGLDRCKQFCLKLLLASRLGLNIDANAARTAAYSLDLIIRDLEQLRNATFAAYDGE